MAYKVSYYTLAQLPEGKVGNIKQGEGHFYTDENIAAIPELIRQHLEPKGKVPVIQKIESVGGITLNFTPKP